MGRIHRRLGVGASVSIMERVPPRMAMRITVRPLWIQDLVLLEPQNDVDEVACPEGCRHPGEVFDPIRDGANSRH